VRVMVVPTELAVPVAVGMLLEVLEVQPLQSHPGPLEFPVDPGHVGHGPGHADHVAHTPEEQYAPTVPTPTPQARAIARWGKR
jgi:hypothetical protein